MHEGPRATSDRGEVGLRGSKAVPEGGRFRIRRVPRHWDHLMKRLPEQ